MPDEYVFVRDVASNEWGAFPPSGFKKGDKVIRYRGHTYGLDREDAIYANRETIPVRTSNMPEDGFFTCPVEFLVDLNGMNPVGEYLTRDRAQQIREQYRQS